MRGGPCAHALRGARVGRDQLRPEQRGARHPVWAVANWGATGHRFEPLFAANANAPATWECPRCGLPAGRDEQHPPGKPRSEPYKSHLAYVKERRSEAEGAAILAEALPPLRQRRRGE